MKWPKKRAKKRTMLNVAALVRTLPCNSAHNVTLSMRYLVAAPPEEEESRSLSHISAHDAALKC
jgi:hypothetical protein